MQRSLTSLFLTSVYSAMWACPAHLVGEALGGHADLGQDADFEAAHGEQQVGVVAAVHAYEAVVPVHGGYAARQPVLEVPEHGPPQVHLRPPAPRPRSGGAAANPPRHLTHQPVPHQAASLQSGALSPARRPVSRHRGTLREPRTAPATSSATSSPAPAPPDESHVSPQLCRRQIWGAWILGCRLMTSSALRTWKADMKSGTGI